MKDISEIKSFAKHIELPSDAYAEAIPLCEKIISSFSKDYDAVAQNLKDPAPIYTLAEKMGTERDLTMLAVCLLLGADAHDLYQKRGISEEIYWNSMRDLTIWTKTCQKMRGHNGFYEYGWFLNFLTASIVRLHRLEFHQIAFLEGQTWSRDGITVNGGDTVINIHIPEDGPLYHDDVMASYRQAYRYFQCRGKQAFVCNSWLLYPGNNEILPQHSNIREFMRDFDIIVRDDSRFSGDLWRVFGPCRAYDDTSNFPRHTELQRRMIKYLEEHDFTTGAGYGIFLFDGEKIIK